MILAECTNLARVITVGEVGIPYGSSECQEFIYFMHRLIVATRIPKLL